LLLHDVLRNRLECEGFLLMETALHIGAGQSSPTTDAGVIRDHQGRPFIPGSSLKGALRSAVERRAEWLGLTSCRLEPGYPSCLSTNHLAAERWRSLPLEERREEFDQELCDTCKLFGSTSFAAKVHLDDLPVVESLEEITSSLIEVRDGVGIDRDSGTAAEGVKFDYEVVASLTAFRFSLTSENLESAQSALLSLGLLEMMNGAVPLGGKSTRGLGRCRLSLQRLYHVAFTQGDALTLATQLLDHLRPPKEREVGLKEDPRAFLLKVVQDYLEEKRGA
jgi:CRISPR-associated protein Csm3